MRRSGGFCLWLLACGLVTGLPALWADEPAVGRLELLPASAPAGGVGSDLPVELVLDDGTAEAGFGIVDGGGAAQFAWLNRFALPADLPSIYLAEIAVLFPANGAAQPGDPIELVVYRDADGDLANGATLVASWGAVVASPDGVTFSPYPVTPPIRFEAGEEVVVGVINRWVESGVSPPSSPATLDLDSATGRSWLAVWGGDPPAPPELDSAQVLEAIGVFQPAADGTWMIRAFAQGPGVVEIPTIDTLGLLLLAALLALAGASILGLRSS